MNRLSLLCGFLLVALVLAAQVTMAAEREALTLRRPVGVSMQGLIWQGAGAPRQATAGDDSPAMSVNLSTVDTDLYTGYENAIYAADELNVFVAYKRFLSDPSLGGYLPAELRVAKSSDSGRTWTITVVDADAIESGDSIENSVSIDGDRGSTIYVAYHVRSSGLFVDMKLKVAKSTDGGSTWTTQTVADGYTGDQNSIRVLSANAAVISAHANGPAEGIHAFITSDGGARWSDTLVAGGLGNGFYTSVAAADTRSIWVSFYNSLFPDHTDMNAGTRLSGGAWKTVVVEGMPSDSNLTGLASSITVASNGTVFAAYEADTASGNFVIAASTTDGTRWDLERVQRDDIIGWNTAIHESNGTLYLSYWRLPIGGKGLAMFAMSSDNGATWTPFTVPDSRFVQPYIDSTAPSNFMQFESYQTVDPFTFQQPILRVARIGG